MNRSFFILYFNFYFISKSFRKEKVQAFGSSISLHQRYFKKLILLIRCPGWPDFQTVLVRVQSDSKFDPKLFPP